MAPPILWDIYEEHLDEAAFLWAQREQALDAANYSLDDVISGPEERLLAHLDGLVLGGGRVAQRLLIPALDDDDVGKVASAAWALLQAEDADYFALVFEALAKAKTQPARAAMGRAFDLSHRADLPARMLPLLEASAPAVQAVIVDVVSAGAAERGAPPQPPTSQLPLEPMLKTRNPELLRAALRALRRAPDPAYARYVESPLSSAYVTVRDTAIETAMILGMRAGWQTCSKLVARQAVGARLPLALLALGGEHVDVRSVIKRLDVETMRRDALWALGFAGTVEAAEAALRLIGDAESAPLAAETFATITGLPLSGAFVTARHGDRAPPPAAPTDSDDDEPLPEVRAQDDLPVPDVERVRAWWAKAKGRFSPEVRVLGGAPINQQSVRDAIAGGPTWRRSIWCLELAMRGPFDMNVHTWARTQKQSARLFPAELSFDGKLPARARS